MNLASQVRNWHLISLNTCCDQSLFQSNNTVEKFINQDKNPFFPLLHEGVLEMFHWSQVAFSDKQMARPLIKILHKFLQDEDEVQYFHILLFPLVPWTHGHVGYMDTLDGCFILTDLPQ
jgi:hypothetical protein